MENEQVWEFAPEHMTIVLDEFKQGSQLLMRTETEKICEVYRKLFQPNENGKYEISLSHLNMVVSALVDETLLELVSRDYVSMSCDENGEFIFSMTEKGRRAIEEGWDRDE